MPWQNIIQGFRPTYSGGDNGEKVDFYDILDSELGQRVKDVEIAAPIMSVPFGGKKR